MGIGFHFNVTNRLMYACRALRKARSRGMRCVVLCSDAGRLNALDRMLWEFSAQDFIPHAVRGSALYGRAAVFLEPDLDGAPDADLLVLLEDTAPADIPAVAARYPTVIDIVQQDEEQRAMARVRFRAWKAAGLAPDFHDMAGH